MKRELSDSTKTSDTRNDSNKDRDDKMNDTKKDSNVTGLEEAKKNEREGDMDSGSDIDDDQLEEYQELLEELGNHADKVIINTLTMVAEDHASSFKAATTLYNCIKNLLISNKIHPERKLPLVYVIDSILKNINNNSSKSHFISIVEGDAENWLPIVYESLDQHPNTKVQTAKLKKVLHTWKDFQVFPDPIAVTKMVQCLDEFEAKKKLSQMDPNNQGEGGAILNKISPTLRNKMQDLLDEIHSDVDELEKVSLERLAVINPELLTKIKSIAMGEMDDNQNTTSSVSSKARNNDDVETSNENETYHFPHEASLFSTCVSKEHLKRSQDWIKMNDDITNVKTKAGDLVNHFQQHIMLQSKNINDKNNANDTSVINPGLIAAASATANHISQMLQQLQFIQDGNNTHHLTISDYPYPVFAKSNGKSSDHASSLSVLTNNKGLSINAYSYGNSNAHALLLTLIDKSLFNTKDIAKKMNHHDRVVSMLLYEEGLPFLSTSDGRRFKTQLDLSNHLDALFRKSQLEKMMERTEERGWNISSSQWCGNETESYDMNAKSENNLGVTGKTGVNGELSDEKENTNVLADENRSRCVICGNPFEMFFDQEEGAYMYKNCREIELLNDEAAEEESEDTLVHTRCLQGLGSPEFLTMDQVLQH